MNNLVNVVVGAVVDASVYAFGAQAVIFLFASLDVIFNANLFHLPFLEMAQQASNPHQSLRFVFTLSCRVVLMVIVISMLRVY